MTLFRAAARTMLASYFVASGVRALRSPQTLVDDAEPIVDRVVPLVKEYAPAQVAGFIPDDTATLVRVQGVLQVVGGVALATGKGRRIGAALLAGSLVPSTLAKHPFWSRATPEERAIDREHFLKNVSLLGGVLLAARDTEGKPSLAYRATKGSHALTRDTRRAIRKGKRETKELVDNVAEGVAGGGALLVSTAAATGRKARREAGKQLKYARKAAGHQLADAKKGAAAAAKEARKLAKQARKDGRRLAHDVTSGDAGKAARALSKEASKRAQALSKDASKLLDDLSKDAGKRAKSLSKDAGKRVDDLSKDAAKLAESIKSQAADQLDAARKAAGKVAENIHLGEN